jgi:hypothetical protein
VYLGVLHRDGIEPAVFPGRQGLCIKTLRRDRQRPSAQLLLERLFEDAVSIGLRAGAPPG